MHIQYECHDSAHVARPSKAVLRTAITGDVEGDFEALQRLFWQFDAASVGSLMNFFKSKTTCWIGFLVSDLQISFIFLDTFCSIYLYIYIRVPCLPYQGQHLRKKHDVNAPCWN